MALITTQTIKGPFDAIAANGADIVFTAGNTGGDTITLTGREIILAYNSHASISYTITITSVADEKGRIGNITTYNLDFGEFAAFGIGLTNSPGWRDPATGLLSVTVSNAAVKWAVLKLPAGYPG